MPDGAPRYRHRFEPWREQLIAAIALLREADQRDPAACSLKHLAWRRSRKAQELDAVVGRIDAMPTRTASGGRNAAPPRAAWRGPSETTRRPPP